MSFKQTIKELSKLSRFSNEQVQELTEILKSKAFLPDDFLIMINHFGRILHSTPELLYMEMIGLTQVFTSELIALGRINDTEKKDEIGFPHLVIVTINLNLAYKLELLGLYGEAHKALLKAKDPWVIPYDSVTKKGDLYLTRSSDVDHYMMDIGFTFPDVIKRIFVSRAALGFRLSKIMGDVEGESHEAYLRYKPFAKLENPEQHDVLFYTNYLDLLNPTLPQAQEIVTLLISCYGNEENTNHRFLIASCLAVHLKSAKWTSRATEELDTYFWAELLYMKVLEVCHGKSVDGNKLIELFWEFMMKAHRFYPDRTLFELIKQKYSVILNQVLVTCIEKNELHLLMSLVYNWNSYRPGKQSFQEIGDKNIFVTIPNVEVKGPIFLVKYNDEIIFIPIKSDISLNRIMELRSRVEADWYTLIDNDQPLIFIEETFTARHQLDSSIEYCKAIKDFIGIETLHSILEDLPTQINFEYIETSWSNTPIVSILCNETKHHFTISGGNQQHPLPAQIKQVLIWCDPTEEQYISNFELKGLLKILEKHNVSVEVVIGAECTKESFLERYKDPKYDLIWVITHGSFNSNNPPQSSLTISKTQEITAWELQKSIPQMDKSRYLVLNACYSGCANVRNNSIGFLGLAPSATNENQIVLGHLWFVDPLAAGILGILTLNSVINGETIQSSLIKATSTMIKGKEEIIESLSAIDTEIEMIERVKNTSIQFHIPFYSMSGIVYK